MDLSRLIRLSRTLISRGERELGALRAPKIVSCLLPKSACQLEVGHQFWHD